MPHISMTGKDNKRIVKSNRIRLFYDFN